MATRTVEIPTSTLISTSATTAVALPERSFNPYHTFTFTDTNEWISTLATAVLDAFPNVEGCSNLHAMRSRIKDEALDLKDIDWYRLMVFAEPGGNEGHYVIVRAEHRKSFVSITLLSAKVLNGLDYAIDVAGFITRCLFSWHP